MRLKDDRCVLIPVWKILSPFGYLQLKKFITRLVTVGSSLNVQLDGRENAAHHQISTFRIRQSLAIIPNFISLNRCFWHRLGRFSIFPGHDLGILETYPKDRTNQHVGTVLRRMLRKRRLNVVKMSWRLWNGPVGISLGRYFGWYLSSCRFL